MREQTHFRVHDDRQAPPRRLGEDRRQQVRGDPALVVVGDHETLGARQCRQDLLLETSGDRGVER